MTGGGNIIENQDTLIIPELEELIRKSNYGWATPEIRGSISKYWGIRGTNRQQVYDAICKKYNIQDVSFNQMRYFVSMHMHDLSEPIGE